MSLDVSVVLLKESAACQEVEKEPVCMSRNREKEPAACQGVEGMSSSILVTHQITAPPTGTKWKHPCPLLECQPRLTVIHLCTCTLQVFTGDLDCLRHSRGYKHCYCCMQLYV